MDKKQALVLKKAGTKVSTIARKVIQPAEAPEHHVHKWSSVFEAVVDLLVLFKK